MDQTSSHIIVHHGVVHLPWPSPGQVDAYRKNVHWYRNWLECNSNNEAAGSFVASIRKNSITLEEASTLPHATFPWNWICYLYACKLQEIKFLITVLNIQQRKSICFFIGFIRAVSLLKVLGPCKKFSQYSLEWCSRVHITVTSICGKFPRTSIVIFG